MATAKEVEAKAKELTDEYCEGQEVSIGIREFVFGIVKWVVESEDLAG